MAKSSRTQQPITRHPLFPAIVALWFGALFGLGSLAIRASLLESAVVATGIDLIIPAAAPPLGVTARILLALMMALVGGLVGVSLGLRMGRVKAEAPARRRTSLAAEEPPLPQRADAFTYAQPETPRRPLSAFDDLPDDEQIDSEPIEAPSPSRRRQLAMEEPTRPDYARAFAPLPGASPDGSEFKVLDLAEPLNDEFQPENWAPEDTLTELDPTQATAEITPTAPFPRLNAAPGADAAVVLQRFTVAELVQESGGSGRPGEDEVPRFTAETIEPVIDDDRDLPPRNLGRFANPETTEELVSAQALAESVAEPVPSITFAPGSGTAAEQLRAAPLETLSHIQLIERLALSMQQRREIAARAAVTPVTPTLTDVTAPPTFEAMRFGFEPKEPVDLPELTKPPFAAPSPAGVESARPFERPLEEPEELAFAPPAMPAAMRPISFDLHDDADDEPILPPQRFAFAPPAAPAVSTGLSAHDDDEMDAEDAADESYSSLLGRNHAQFRQPLIRIEEPAADIDHIEPVVVFPGHGNRPFAAPEPATPDPTPAPAPALAPAPTQPGVRLFDAPASNATSPSPSPARIDPEETERALRAALSTLQRMSGAA